MAFRVQVQQALQGITTVGAALLGTSTGVKMSYVVPAGRQAQLKVISCTNFVLAPTVALQIIVGGVTITLASAVASNSIVTDITLNAGDTAQLNVTALVGASAFDGCISAQEYLAV